MKYLWIIRSLWILFMIISIATMTENITRNPNCPCRSIDECLNEIRSNSKNSKLVSFFSPCESSQDEIMIRCCTFHTSINKFFLCVSQNNTSREQIKCILHEKLRMIHLINFLGQMKYSSSMMEELTSEILSPSTNSMHLEYTGPRISGARGLKSTESNNSKKIIQDMIAVIKTNQVQSLVAIYPNDFETDVTKINLTDKKMIPPSPIENNFFVKTDAHSSFPIENTKYVPSFLSGNIDSNNPYAPKQEIYIENVDETKARYEKKSMVSSSMSKDVPTTPAVNSFEQKTSSETFLSLDRISTQPINKNTPTNKSEAQRNNSNINVFITAKRSPPFSVNAQKNQRLTVGEINSGNKLHEEETNWNHREFPFVENTKEMTLPRIRDDPLQASTRNKRMTAPIISQKDILNKNTEEAEYKNNTTRKKNTKPSFQNNQSEVRIKEERKGSTSENATKNFAVIYAALPMQRFRFPPKFLPARLNKPRTEERNSTIRIEKFQNLDRFSSSHFQHFYKAKEDLLLKINNITKFEKIKSSTHFELLSNASQAYLSRNKNTKALKNSEAIRDAINIIKMSNVSALNDSINIDKNDSYEYSASNLQNAFLTSNKIASHLNTSLQEIEKSSMQMETMTFNDDTSSTPKNNSKMSSETIVQNITDNLKQLSKINEDNAQKYFSTKSSIDNQLNQNKTKSAHLSELSISSVNADEQMSDASTD
ncbi:putative uncharacterized protein DDB_G0267840 [Nylanderia fulva]|uniref:putative uncharacterized protein DDB_G0267840 n=1 Tax=Nylanderia fulva TaxID=613905 RepID=UPI0010FBAAB0|nr:putative uncharacterized protein DDB_G0267840 [Nylanderia fulva]